GTPPPRRPSAARAAGPSPARARACRSRASGARGPWTDADRDLLPRQLLPQPRGDDRLVARLQIDRIDRDLVEVAALVRALLHVDVRLALRERHLHRVARGTGPVRREIDDGVGQHAIDRIVLDDGAHAANVAESLDDRGADVGVALHLSLFVFRHEALQRGDEATDLFLRRLRRAAERLVRTGVQRDRAHEIATAGENPRRLRPANALAAAEPH